MRQRVGRVPRVADESEVRYRMARRDHAVVGAASAESVEPLILALPGVLESQYPAEVIGLRIAGRPVDVRVPRIVHASAINGVDVESGPECPRTSGPVAQVIPGVSAIAF